jgi:extracellular elastinolytic metalloproteinase
LITHIYARQLINGLEVSDGDINVNIDRDGRVLSWGNSFHPGPAPSAFDLDTSSDETEHVCEQLKTTISGHKAELASLKGDEGAWGFVKAAAEMVLGGLGGERKVTDEAQIRTVRQTLKHAKHHYKAVCKGDVAAASSEKMLAPVDALLALLPRVAEDHDLLEDLDHGDFASTPHHSLKPKAAPAEPPTEVISGPGLAKAGVLSDVPARLMYTQTSTGAPRMVWKLDVEMQHNWYEAYLDVATGELLRIVDWANDLSWDTPTGDNKVEAKKGGKQKPLPSPPKKLEPYTYQIVPWGGYFPLSFRAVLIRPGVNDPLTGNLSVVTKPWDTVASPLGWHVIPTSANPWNAKIPGMNVTGNTTTFYTTVGNNVIAHEDWEGQNNYLLNYRPVNDSMVFAYDYGEADGLAPKEYADMVITQLFYTSNMYHDLLYRLGFDEISGEWTSPAFVDPSAPPSHIEIVS